MPKKAKFYIKYRRTTEFGGTKTTTERFEYAENRDLVLKAMLANNKFKVLEVGGPDEEL